MLDIPCVIFAGGKSSRMGEDKALLPFGEHPTLTQYQLSRLSKIFKNVYISCKNKNKFSFNANFIEDIPSANVYAPTTGFVATYKELQVDRFFVISVDSPFISEDIIKKLISLDNGEADATIAKTEHRMEPMCGVYHSSLSSSFAKMLKEDNHKLGYLLKNAKTKFVNFEDKKLFLNLNHPKDYEEAKGKLCNMNN